MNVNNEQAIIALCILVGLSMEEATKFDEEFNKVTDTIFEAINNLDMPEGLKEHGINRGTLLELLGKSYSEELKTKGVDRIGDESNG